MNKTTAERVAKYTNTFHGRLKTLLKGAKSSAKKRDQEFSITYADLVEIWQKQKGKCIYTGWDMTTETNDLTLVSIERVVNDIGYTPENCVLSCWCVNRAKSTLDKETFIKMCKDVYKKNNT